MTDKFGHVRTYLRTNKYINTQSSVSLEGLDLLVELLFMMTLPLKLIALSLGGYCVLSLFFFVVFACARSYTYRKIPGIFVSSHLAVLSGSVQAEL